MVVGGGGGNWAYKIKKPTFLVSNEEASTLKRRHLEKLRASLNVYISTRSEK